MSIFGPERTALAADFDPVKYFSVVPSHVTRGAVLRLSDMRTKDGKPVVDEYHYEGCHRYVGQAVRGHVRGYYSALWVSPHTTRAKAEAYWKFILDPERSPWRMILKGREFITNAQGQLIAWFIPIPEESYPTDVVMNLSIATRLPWEQTASLDAWHIFKEKGFDDYDALYLMGHMQFLRGYFTSNSHHVHFAFDVTNGGVKCSSLRTGEIPNVDRTRLFGKDDYKGINRIWWTEGMEHAWLDNKLCQRQKYTGHFVKWASRAFGERLIMEDKGYPNPDALLPKLKELRDAWQ